MSELGDCLTEEAEIVEHGSFEAAILNIQQNKVTDLTGEEKMKLEGLQLELSIWILLFEWTNNMA